MFTLKPTISNASLAAKKTKILGVFSTMQAELQQLHDQQKEYGESVKEQLKALSEELTAVETSRAETLKTINNIDKFLK